MKTAQYIREAAQGPTPKIGRFTNFFGVSIADWVGYSRQWDVIKWKADEEGLFSEQDEDTQRTFLLLVAEALS